jgi:hypothetical protein
MATLIDSLGGGMCGAIRTAGTGRRHTALTHRLQEAGNTAS